MKASHEAIQGAFNEASGSWAGADWTHEVKLNGKIVHVDGNPDNEPVVCDGNDDCCETCLEAKAAAEAAEEYAAEALECLDKGWWDLAKAAAAKCRAEENQWGDCPVWFTFESLVEAYCDEMNEAEYAAIQREAYAG